MKDCHKQKQEDDEEKRHFKSVLYSFASYRFDSISSIICHKKRSFERLSIVQKQLLSSVHYDSLISEAEECVKSNQRLVNLMLNSGDVGDVFENAADTYNDVELEKIWSSNLKELSNDVRVRSKTSPEDASKVRSTLRQIVRDWTEEGSDEREQCYRPIVEKIQCLFKNKLNNDSNDVLKVLVPGSGLGRLVYDIAQISSNMDVQGNEFSLQMLLISNFILNKTSSHCGGEGVLKYQVHPWVHQWTNVMRREDLIRSASFPDVDPSDLPFNSHLSMAAGDFMEIYADDAYNEQFDCVVTSFFVDCSQNVSDTVQLIYKVLKSDGHWINLGPLMYHFSDVVNRDSIEPPFDVLKEIIKQCGFTFNEPEVLLDTTYCNDKLSMFTQMYKSIFFTCSKKAKSPFQSKDYCRGDERDDMVNLEQSPAKKSNVS